MLCPNVESEKSITSAGCLSKQTIFVFTIFSAVRHLGETAWGWRHTQISGDYIRVCVRGCVQPCTYSEQDEITELPKSLSSQLKIFSYHRIGEKNSCVGG